MNQAGRSMIEMMGVLAIVGILSVGGIASFSQAMMKSKINKTLQQISTISSAVSSLDVATYEGLRNKTVVAMKAVKAVDGKTCVHNEDTCIENPFSGWTTVAPADDGAYYTIELTKVPEDACISLVSHEWPTKGNFVGIMVNGTKVTPTQVDSADSSCSSNENIITVKYQ